jgi:RimJ/RimL family protein N-acetyltransferase
MKKKRNMTTPHLLQGAAVRLRFAIPKDKRMIYNALAHSDLTDRLLGHPDENSTPLLSWQAFCDDYVSHYFDDSNPFGGRCFVIEVDGKSVGQVNYNKINADKRRVELDIWMFSEALCGHGYGTDALLTLCDYLSSEFGVLVFVIQPSTSNRRAIRAYEKAGFRKVSLSSEEAENEYGPKGSVDGIYMTRNIGQPAGGDAEDLAPQL